MKIYFIDKMNLINLINHLILKIKLLNNLVISIIILKKFKKLNFQTNINTKTY